MIAQHRTIREAIRATEEILTNPPPALHSKLRAAGKHTGMQSHEVMGEWLDDTRKRLKALRHLLAAVETSEAIQRAAS